MTDLARVDLAVGLTALLSAAYGGWRFIRPRWRRFSGKVTGAIDSIVGREAICDPITGAELAPPLPGIGVRMSTQERQMELLTVTVTKLVDQQVRQQKLEQRVEDHESRLAKLETNQVERIVSHAESTAAFRAIETAIKATPDIEGDLLDEH